MMLKRKSRDPDGRDHGVGCNDCSRVGYSAANQFSDSPKEFKTGTPKDKGLEVARGRCARKSSNMSPAVCRR